MHLDRVEREETWGGLSPHHPTRAWGSVVSSRSGVRVENGFYAYLRPERIYLKHHFQYFLSDGAPPPRMSRGPGKLPLSTGLVRTTHNGSDIAAKCRNLYDVITIDGITPTLSSFDVRNNTPPALHCNWG